MQIKNDQTVTINEVMSVIDIALENALITEELSEAADWEKYNAVVGTTFDEDSWTALANDDNGVTYLYAHIPVGAKIIFEDKKKFNENGDNAGNDDNETSNPDTTDDTDDTDDSNNTAPTDEDDVVNP